MQEVAEILPSRVRELLSETGKSMRAVSLAIGAHAGYVRDLLDPVRFNVPSATRLEALAGELGVSTEYLLGKTANPDPMRSDAEIGPELTTGSISDRYPVGDPIPVLGTGDCAEMEVCAVDGETLLVERSSFDADLTVRYITRPPALASRRNLYAIVYRGESMEPRFFSGEVGLVDPDWACSSGDFVLVQMGNGEDDQVVTVLVKQLVRRNAKEVVLRQFNPPSEFVVPRAKVLRVHRILPPTELLFG